MADDPTKSEPTLKPWDRELVVDARARGRRGDEVGGTAGGLPQRAALADGIPAAHRPEPHPIFLLAPWAGVVAFACAVFGSIGPWLLSYDYSNVIFAADVAAVALGIYASLGAWRGRGRADIAGGALLLGIIGITLWFWVGRPAPLLTPT